MISAVVIALTLLFVSVECFSFGPKIVQRLSTKLNENFSPDFKNPKIESAKEIFTEKQLREFTATYSEDVRFNPIELLLGAFSKKSEPVEKTVAATSSIENSLKPTVSLKVLEEKTALYVKGKSDAKTYAGVLKAAFGSNLQKVLPEILANLPADKATALASVAK